MILSAFIASVWFLLFGATAHAFDGASLSESDVQETLNESAYSQQALKQFQVEWEEFSADLRRSQPVHTSTEREQRLRSLVETKWSDADLSLRRLQLTLRVRTSFPVGARIKGLANLDSVRSILAEVVGSNAENRTASYMSKVKVGLEANSSMLIAGTAGMAPEERLSWEGTYLDPIDSYLYYSIDYVNRIRLATATWPDVRNIQVMATRLVEYFEAGIYRSPESLEYCKIEIRKSQPNEGSSDWLYVRIIADQSTSNCVIGNGDWQIFSCGSRGNEVCEGFAHQNTDLYCRIFRPGLQSAEFDLHCSSWERSWKFRKL